jgi:uncharacterized repeat protein (TIGR01451 family)
LVPDTTAGPTGGGTATTLAVGDTTTSTPEVGKLKVCKLGNNGTFSVSVKSTLNGSPTPNPSGSSTVAVNTCRVVAEDPSNVSGTGTWFTLGETSSGCVSVVRNDVGFGITPITCANTDYFINIFHGTTVTFTNAGPPQLAVVKTPDAATFTQGSQVSFTIVVSNPAPAGSQAATSVTLNDALPGAGGLVWATATTTQGTCTNPIVGNALSCQLGTIAAGGSVTVTVTSSSTTPDAACQVQSNPAANATATGGLTATDSGSLRCDLPLPPPPSSGPHGCTPGFWKNHATTPPWTTYSPSQTVGSVFTIPAGIPGASTLSAETLLVALDGGGGSGLGGKAENLIRAAIAALLNAAAGNPTYPITTSQIISQTNAALASLNQGTISNKANQFDNWNNQCDRGSFN